MTFVTTGDEGTNSQGSADGGGTANANNQVQAQGVVNANNTGGAARDRSHVQCFRCQEFGHYANQCPYQDHELPRPTNNSNNSTGNNNNNSGQQSGTQMMMSATQQDNSQQ